MAKASVGYSDIISSIKRKSFAPIYLLMGDEPYYLDKIVEALEENVVDEDDRDFNLYSFYGADADPETVAATALQYPVMAQRQLVILKEAQAMMHAKTQLGKLAAYAERPSASTVLAIVFKDEALAATSKLLKNVAKSGGIVFKSAKPRDYELPKIINAYCKEKNIDINDKAVIMLSEYIGTDLSRLFGEIDKLTIGQRSGSAKITADSVVSSIGITKDYNAFELVNALTAKDYPKAMRIADYCEKNPKQNPLQKVIPFIFSSFSRLLIAQSLRDKSDASLMNALQLKSPYALRELRGQMARFTLPSLIKIISHVRRADCRSKGIGSAAKEADILKELIFAIFTS